MRPVERGLAPQTYAQYRDAIEDLKSRLGSYCSYCERQVAASLAVEHVIPKSLRPELEKEWHNFLLGCTNCNSVKGDRVVELQNFIWPDRDNTLLALVYSKGGFIRLADNLDNNLKTKAQAFIFCDKILLVANKLKYFVCYHIRFYPYPSRRNWHRS
jgi:uncharacterized protein (TIGR02646 family)